MLFCGSSYTHSFRFTLRDTNSPQTHWIVLHFVLFKIMNNHVQITEGDGMSHWGHMLSEELALFFHIFCWVHSCPLTLCSYKSLSPQSYVYHCFCFVLKIQELLKHITHLLLESYVHKLACEINGCHSEQLIRAMFILKAWRVSWNCFLRIIKNISVLTLSWYQHNCHGILLWNLMCTHFIFICHLIQGDPIQVDASENWRGNEVAKFVFHLTKQVQHF